MSLYMVAFIVAGMMIVIVFGFIASRPSEFRVTRSLLIDATAGEIYERIVNLHKWQSWSPWVRLDPQAQYAFSGPEQGVGASTSWTGTRSGQGTSTIVNAVDNQNVTLRLDFLRPMKATNMTEFGLKTENGQTIVTWSMSGKNNFIAKAMSLVFDCDKMVGGQFEAGLENLRKIVETKK